MHIRDNPWLDLRGMRKDWSKAFIVILIILRCSHLFLILGVDPHTLQQKRRGLLVHVAPKGTASGRSSHSTSYLESPVTSNIRAITSTQLSCPKVQWAGRVYIMQLEQMAKHLQFIAFNWEMNLQDESWLQIAYEFTWWGWCIDEDGAVMKMVQW